MLGSRLVKGLVHLVHHSVYSVKVWCNWYISSKWSPFKSFHLGCHWSVESMTFVERFIIMFTLTIRSLPPYIWWRSKVSIDRIRVLMSDHISRVVLEVAVTCETSLGIIHARNHLVRHIFLVSNWVVSVLDIESQRRVMEICLFWHLVFIALDAFGRETELYFCTLIRNWS